MQRKNKPISSEAHVTLPDLSVTNEPALLNLAIGYYAVQHPLEKPHNGLARCVGTSEGSLIQAAAGNSHLGLDAWIAIEKAIGIDLMQAYINQKRGVPHDSPESVPRDQGEPLAEALQRPVRQHRRTIL